MIHTSPAPVRVCKLPSFESLAVRNAPFGKVVPRGITLEDLSVIEIPDAGHLQEAALQIGQLLIDKVNPKLTAVDIRSGSYDPRTTMLYIPAHFDINQVMIRPVDVFMLSTNKAGYVAVGDARIKTEEELPLLADVPGTSLARRQSHVGELGQSIFDTTGMYIEELEPSALYYLPKGSLHWSPTDPGPYGRNFFRIKKGCTGDA